MFGLFRKNKKQQEVTAGFEAVVVDLHSHILPGIDDGAQTLEDSVMLIQGLMDVGIKKIITTPHIMADYYRNNANTIHEALSRLKQHLADIQMDADIEAAAEHYFDEHFLELIDRDELMLIKDKYVLFELAFTGMSPNVIPVIQRITAKGLVPILAHPERYPYLTVEEASEFKSWGCLLQLNTISLTGYYGKRVKQSAEKFIDAGLIDFMASDMHHERHVQALKQSQSNPYVQKLITSGQLQNTLLL